MLILLVVMDGDQNGFFKKLDEIIEDFKISKITAYDFFSNTYVYCKYCFTFFVNIWIW